MNICKTLACSFAIVLFSEARLEAYLDPGSGSMSCNCCSEAPLALRSS